MTKELTCVSTEVKRPLKIPVALQCNAMAGGTTKKTRKTPVVSENDSGPGECNAITLWDKNNGELQKQ